MAVIPKAKSVVTRCKYGINDAKKAIENETSDNPNLRKVMMGMAFKESKFDSCAVGDNGKAIGVFQIWHKLHGLTKDQATDPYFAAKWTKARLLKYGFDDDKVTYAIQKHNGIVKCRAGEPCSNGIWTGYAESVKHLAKRF